MITEQAGETPATIGARVRRRVAQWRQGTFGPASEQPYRRRTSDRIRVVVAIVTLLVLGARYGELSQSEKDLFTLVNGLPDVLEAVFTTLFRVGTLWAVGLVVAAALLARRWRLARDMAISGVSAWFLAHWIGERVVGHVDLPSGLDIVTRAGNATPFFPPVRLALIVAVIAVASPYLTRPVRRIGQTLIVLMAFAAMYLGTGTPDGALAAIVLGWGIAAGVHVVFGSPGGRPTRAQVAAALAELGVSARDVEIRAQQPIGGTLMVACDDEGPLAVRVLGRDEADAQLLAKLWRFLVYKEGGPQLHLTRLEDVEHEAYTVLLARDAGVRAPEIVVAGTAGPGAAVLVERPLEGTLLADGDTATVTDAVLDELWQQVARMHGARVAHGTLNANHVVLTDRGPAIADFASSSGAATADGRAADVAELLTSTALIVGSDRAVAAAARGIGTETLLSALPRLQPAALSHELRPRQRHERKELVHHLGTLRETAAATIGAEPPPLQQLYRVDATSLLMAVGTLIAVFALLGQVGDPGEFFDTMKSAEWAWLAVALIISFATNIATAIALMGTVPVPLPLWRTSELQLSMSFSNLAVPAVGGLASQIRFLQKQGVELSAAATSGGLIMSVGNTAAQVVLFVIALALSPTTVNIGKVPVDKFVSFVLLATVVAGIVAGVMYGIPRLRRLVARPVKSAASTIWGTIRSPRRLSLLLGGNALNAVLYALVMDACIAAFGAHIDFFALLAINIGIATIASLVPVPGGGTAVASVSMTGALVAAGISTEAAVAAVLANQLVANFIPAVPGWFATRNMLNQDYL